MDVTIPCACPIPPDGQARHPDGDTVTLRDKLDWDTAVLLQKSIQVQAIGGTSTQAVMAMMTKFYVRHCIASWTLVDEKGAALEVAQENIADRIESNLEAAFRIGDAADDLYRDTALPLVIRAFGSLRPTPTDEPTSPKKSGSQKPRKRSKPSSTSTIPTVVTGLTSTRLDGASSSLPSSATA
jgi:hypothetical protein